MERLIYSVASMTKSSLNKGVNFAENIKRMISRITFWSPLSGS